MSGKYLLAKHTVVPKLTMPPFLAQCPRCQGSGNEAGKGVLQRYKLARRDGLHWSFARCVQVPDDAGLARWHKQRTQQIERMRARAEKQAEEAAKNAAK